jgi:hypothetical protein
VQNAYWKLLQEVYPQLKQRAAPSWLDAFKKLGERLNIRVS